MLFVLWFSNRFWLLLSTRVVFQQRILFIILSICGSLRDISCGNLPSLRHNEGDTRCLHDGNVLCFSFSAIVLFLGNHSSNTERDHSLATYSVFNLNYAIFLGIQPVCVKFEVHRCRAKRALLTAGSDNTL